MILKDRELDRAMKQRRTICRRTRKEGQRTKRHETQMCEAFWSNQSDNDQRQRILVCHGKCLLHGTKQAQNWINNKCVENPGNAGTIVDGLPMIHRITCGIKKNTMQNLLKKLQQDNENDLIIKDHMANLGCLLVCAFGKFLAPVLVAAHTVNNLERSFFVFVAQTQKEIKRWPYTTTGKLIL